MLYLDKAALVLIPLNDTSTAITPEGVLIGNTTGTELVQKTLQQAQELVLTIQVQLQLPTNTGANINADTAPYLVDRKR